jgi:predicted DNA-binding transcriptional regulator YafY
MLKLSAALPDARRGDEERVRQRFYLDSSGWHLGEELVPHLQAVHQAVWQDRKLAISYRLPPLAMEVERLVEPYGLVAKAGVWYLVFAHKERLRARRVSELTDANPSEGTFARPADFDLAAYWQTWCARLEESHSFYPVIVRVAPNFVPELPRFFGGRIRQKVAQAGPPDAEGWIRLELAFESLEAARERIVSFGRGMEVLEPQALRISVLDLARQVVALYER